MRRLGFFCVALSMMAVAGINWKAVWVEPITPILLTVGESKPYTIMGLDGRDVRANLTTSPYLTITSSDPDIVQVDRAHAAFVGKTPGHAEIRISFSEATSIVKAFVREKKSPPERPQ